MYSLYYSFKFPVALKYKTLGGNTIYSDCRKRLRIGSGIRAMPTSQISPELLPESALCPNSQSPGIATPQQGPLCAFVGMNLKAGA